jgi:hypothetical protein
MAATWIPVSTATRISPSRPWAPTKPGWAADLEALGGEPHWRAHLGEILESARGHEARIDDLYQASGRERSGPGRLGGAAATLVAKGRQAVGHAEG